MVCYPGRSKRHKLGVNRPYNTIYFITKSSCTMYRDPAANKILTDLNPIISSHKGSLQQDQEPRHSNYPPYHPVQAEYQGQR